MARSIPKVVTSKDELKQLLVQEKNEQEYESLQANQINWLDGEFWDDWDKVKGHWHKVVKPSSKEQFPIKEANISMPKWFFLAHDGDVIEGKPQLVHDTMQRIPLIRMTSKKDSEGKGDNKKEWRNPKYLFFDERYDKRYDGALIGSLSLDFWVYKIKHSGREYFVYSQERLPDGKCTIKGMTIEINDSSELSSTLKINSLSHIFIAKEAESAIKALSKEKLIKFTKDRKLNLNLWLSHIAQHPLGSINQFPVEVELLRAAQQLSGKVDGWPLHWAVVGPYGTRKTMGHCEPIYAKFDEEIKMASATNYRLKGLIPSFRKSPAEPGYLLQCHRVAIIDEIGKLIESEANKHDRTARNIMGEFNDILEHKDRSGGSGNDFIDITATAKVILVTNPVAGKRTLYDHVGLIDPTAMSRILWWVQDEREQEYVLGKEGILRSSPYSLLSLQNDTESSPYSLLRLQEGEIEKKEIVLKKCRGEIVSIEEYLSVYDSCNNFVCEIDDEAVEALVVETVNLAKEPMKGVWKPRAYHHIKLLVDGLTKLRCLFVDYDTSFAATPLDYAWAKVILTRMVKSWDTNLAPKEELRR